MGGEEVPQRRRGHVLRDLITAVLAVALLIGMYSCSHSCSHPTSGSSAGAQQSCRDAVRAHLKDPKSADFASEHAVEQGRNNWRVTGVVYATNSFGGTVPTAYTCDVTWYDGDYSPHVRLTD